MLLSLLKMMKVQKVLPLISSRVCWARSLVFHHINSEGFKRLFLSLTSLTKMALPGPWNHSFPIFRLAPAARSFFVLIHSFRTVAMK